MHVRHRMCRTLSSRMLTRLAKDRWARDPGITELIAHFDHIEAEWLGKGKKGSPWPALSRKELEVVVAEITRCRDDFSYAARNYFWIIDKQTKQDKLFKLWESQELILDTIMKMKSQGKSQRIICVKARQLGASTVAEALIAHKVIYYRNTDCFIVSYDDAHAAYLFSIVQHIYDKLPWWMKPACYSREFKNGLILDNEPEERRFNPGNNSRVTAKGATAVTGVGQGHALAGIHASEFCDWVPAKAREIIEEDVENALADSPMTFGFLESTAKGAGTYSHDFWQRMERMGDKATWYPLFLPWFFDRSRTISVPSQWKPKQEETDIRTRATADWVRCSDPVCRQYQRRIWGGKDITGETCRSCKTGVLKEFVLSDGKLAWMERRRMNVEDDEDSLNTLKQEMAGTAEEAFRVSGIRLFSERALAYAASTVIDQPQVKGYIDKTLTIHSSDPETGKCCSPTCGMDHRYDDDSLWIWELPQPGYDYVIGADVADGLGGRNDYSVAQIVKKDYLGGPDVQVAEFASNTVPPTAFAEMLVRIGTLYNKAMIAPELNATSGGVLIHALRVGLQYPNLYRPMNASNITLDTHMMGWKTTAGTKPRLYHCFRAGLDSRQIVIRSKFTVTEIHNFRKEDQSSQSMGAMVGHDDRIMALMIAYTVAHEHDWDEEGGMMRMHEQLTLETAPYIFSCVGCANVWPATTPTQFNSCPRCDSMHISATANRMERSGLVINVDAELRNYPDEDEEDKFPSYHSL